MAYFKLEKNKKGELRAKIQVSGKDSATGKNKIFTKRVVNTGNLSEAKFRKQVEKTAIAFEEEVATAYREGETKLRSRILTFAELMKEWMDNVKANLSLNYYERAEDLEVLFNAHLTERHLDDKPISEITVRDVQLFFDELTRNGYRRRSTAKLKKPFPKTVNYRELERENIIDRCRCYKLRQQGLSIKGVCGRDH